MALDVNVIKVTLVGWATKSLFLTVFFVDKLLRRQLSLRLTTVELF